MAEADMKGAAAAALELTKAWASTQRLDQSPNEVWSTFLEFHRISTASQELFE